MSASWVDKAVLYEILSLALGFTARETTQALVNGEFAEAAGEAVRACGIAGEGVDAALQQLESYAGKDPETTFHAVRREYTRLFVGTPNTLVSPYAGIYYAEDRGVTPVLFVNTESMTVERFMKRCGVDRPAAPTSRSITLQPSSSS